MRSSLLILDLKEGKLQGWGKGEDKTFNKLQVFGMNDTLWDKVRGLGSEIWKGCEWVLKSAQYHKRRILTSALSFQLVSDQKESA